MPKPPSLALLHLALLCLLLHPALSPAQASPPNPDISTLHTSTTLVQVPTLVQTSSTELVYSLTAADFALTDDGLPQSLRLEPESQAPLSLVILIQTGGPASAQFPLYNRLSTTLAPLLTGTDQPSQAAIVNFDSKVEGATPFTSDIAQWADAINHPDTGDRGAAIFDALAYAFDLLARQPATNRRAILLLSQPHDDGSHTPLKELLRTAGETNTAIYSLTFSPEDTSFRNQLKGTEHAPHPAITVNPITGPVYGYFDLSLPLNMLIASMRKNFAADIATLTGGEAMHFNNQNELDASLNILSNHVRNRYLLTFTPTSSKPGLHTLQVRLVGHPNLTVSARTTYWANTP